MSTPSSHDPRALRDARVVAAERSRREDLALPTQGEGPLVAVRELGLDLLSLIWPTVCVGCGAADRDCCNACLRELEREVADPDRHRRDLHVAPDGTVPVFAAPAAGTVPVFAAGTYDGVLRSLLIALKHGDQTGFARPLGRALSVPLGEALGRSFGRGGDSPFVSNPATSSPPVLVGVPSRPAKLRERGYHHVELIVKQARRSLAVLPSRPHTARMTRVLKPLRGRTGQVGLSAAERERNAAQIAVRRSLRGRVRGRRVILIDDIMTSGATLRAACNVLIGAGAVVDAVVVLGVVDRADETAGKAADATADETAGETADETAGETAYRAPDGHACEEEKVR